MRRFVLGLALLLGALGAASEEAARPLSSDALVFVAHGERSSFPKSELRRRCALQTVEVEDPYYGERRRYVACPIERVFTLGFALTPGEVAEREVLLRALDGYTRTASGRQLTEGGAYLAFDDADRVARGEAGFDPIDRAQVDPAPFYLVWTGTGRSDPHLYPWPYQLAEIELTSFEARFPNTVPTLAEPGSPPRRGFALFRSQCAHCHAINGEGGKVGPDLNVPRSIVEYRPEGQIKAYIRDPQAFRYTTMPAHLELSDEELDDLVAYFRYMSKHKVDPGPRP